jgi:hypothetical protein
MSTVQQYREYAEGCRALAERLTNPNDKRAVLMIAEAWDRVADAFGLSVVVTEKPCPVVPTRRGFFHHEKDRASGRGLFLATTDLLNRSQSVGPACFPQISRWRRWLGVSELAPAMSGLFLSKEKTAPALDRRRLKCLLDFPDQLGRPQP